MVHIFRSFFHERAGIDVGLLLIYTFLTNSTSPFRHAVLPRSYANTTSDYVFHRMRAPPQHANNRLYGVFTYNNGMATTVSRTSQKTARIDIRLTSEQRELIERAASLTGSTLTQWTAQQLMEAAQRDIEARARLALESEAFDAFQAALDEPLPAEARQLLARSPQWA